MRELQSDQFISCIGSIIYLMGVYTFYTHIFSRLIRAVTGNWNLY